MTKFIPNRTVEYNDNRISKFIAQYGRCAITGRELLDLSDWHCHHKEPYYLIRDDRFSNLIVLYGPVQRLIHLKDEIKIKAILKEIQLNYKEIEMVNKLRRQCNL
ncbi:hypothetical protein [Virgibacillus ainsalahensis]